MLFPLYLGPTFAEFYQGWFILFETHCSQSFKEWSYFLHIKCCDVSMHIQEIQYIIYGSLGAILDVLSMLAGFGAILSYFRLLVSFPVLLLKWQLTKL
jgi:hypothetical protein